MIKMDHAGNSKSVIKCLDSNFVLGDNMRFHLSKFVLSLTVLAPLSLQSAPLSASDPAGIFHFRSFNGTSTTGLSSGDNLFLGLIGVEPDYTQGTTGVATQNGQTRNLGPCADVNGVNGLCTGVSYNEALTGSWTLTFENGEDEFSVETPEVGGVEIPEKPTGFRLTSGGTTPSFSWEPISNTDRLQFDIWDLEDRILGAQDTSNNPGLARKIGEFILENDATSFSVPDNFQLEENHLYSVSINSDVLRTDPGNNNLGFSLEGSLLARSRTFFEFSTGVLPDGNDIFLPTVSTPDGNPVFNFNNPVVANKVEFYDPIVAVGYDYQIGAGNPFFNSFIMPEIGDDLFDLLLWDGTDYVFDQQVGALDEIFFASGGVDRFRILGIETGAELDPTDPTAFVTGLSFVSDGQFTGTMTPITEFVDTTPVPLPASLPMLAVAFGGFAVWRRKQS